MTLPAPPASSLNEQHLRVRLEALKLVKDWSATLIGVQSGLIAVAGGLLKAGSSTPPMWLSGLLFTVSILSIYVGAVVVAGTVPFIVQSLADRPHCDIYAEAGGIARGWLAKRGLGKVCLLQAHFFVGSLILFVAFVMVR